MNKISIALNVVLIIAVGFLYYQVFSGTSSTSTSQEETIHLNIDKSEAENASGTSMNIAYIDIDSFVQNYTFYTSKLKEIERLTKKYESEFAGKQNDYQTKRYAFEQKVQNNAFLTQASYEAEAQKILALEQEIMNFNTEKSQYLMTLQENLMADLQDSIVNYLHNYNADKKYDYVFSSGGPLLYKNTMHNLTDTVTNELNRRNSK